MTKHSRSCSFLLLTENEAPQDALLSTESIEVRPLVPKGILSARQTEIYRCAFNVLHSSSKIDINISSAYLSPSIIASLKIPSRLNPAFKYTFSALGLNEYTSNSKRCNFSFSKAKSRVIPLPRCQYLFPFLFDDKDLFGN